MRAVHVPPDLHVEISEEPSGTFKAVITDGSGNVIRSRSGYTAVDNAQRGVTRWITENYGDHKTEPPTVTKAKKPPRPNSRYEQMRAMMERLADESEAKVAKMRQDILDLEREAKQLRAAVDTLKPPDEE